MYKERWVSYLLKLFLDYKSLLIMNIITPFTIQLHVFLYMYLLISSNLFIIGRNPYCIDKNYGGTLIIWDRIFGK